MTINPEPPKPGEPLLDLIERHYKHYRKLHDSDPQRYSWADRHSSVLDGMADIPLMIRGAARYADRHASRFESLIGEDGVLGPAWLRILSGVRELLNGEIGGLDAGATDGLLLDTARAAGFSEEEVQEL